jgi:UMP-CMP kinase
MRKICFLTNLSSLLVVLWTRRSRAFASSSPHSSWSTTTLSSKVTSNDKTTFSNSYHNPIYLHRRYATRSTDTSSQVYHPDRQSLVGSNFRIHQWWDGESNKGGGGEAVGNDDDESKTISYYHSALGTEFRVIFVLGGPGAGKGTQCTRLLEAGYPCVHLSVGELLRNEQSRLDSPHRTAIQECLIQGTIVPVELSLALLRRAMEEAAAIHGRSVWYLIDGFPRNDDNLTGWIRILRGAAIVWGVLVFTCPFSVLEERILSRNEGRSDDNRLTALKRFHTFEQQTVPVVNALRAMSEPMELVHESDDTLPSPRLLQVHDIPGDRPVDDVWEQVKQIMEGYISNDIWTSQAKLTEAIETNDCEWYRQLCPYVNNDDDDEEDGTTTNPLERYEGIVISKGDSSNVESVTGTAVSNSLSIWDPSIRFITGTKVLVSYFRKFQEQTIREERIWSYDGTLGWRNIHFTRFPVVVDEGKGR